jgi:hypothetical protein
MAVVLDLATKVIDPDQQLWALFPGKNRRYTELFLARKIAFLELPGVNLRPALLVPAADEVLRRHLALSAAIADYYRGGPAPASRNANAYQPDYSQAAHAAVGNTRAMYQRVSAGDLVIMADRSWYDPVHIGEVTSNFEPGDVISLPDVFGDEDIPVRKIKWLPVSEQRRQLPERLSQLLSNRKAIIRLPAEEFSHAIYTLAYGDYVLKDEARYVFPSPTYDNIAPLTIPGTRLLAYFVSAFKASEVNEVEEFFSLSIDAAIAKYFDKDYLHTFEIEFASPGKYVVFSRRAVLPLLVAALVSATNGNISYAEAQHATVENSRGTAQDVAKKETGDKYSAIMDSMGEARFKELHEMNTRAQKGVGLTTGCKQKIAPVKAKGK